MDTHLKIEYIDIDKLKPYDRNPRKIGEEELGGLKASLKELGFVDPLVINKNNVIIGGHQRCLAARELGLNTVPVVYIDLPPDKEKALNIALNNRHIQGDWTADLGDLLGEIKADLPDLYNELLFEPLEIDVPVIEDKADNDSDSSGDGNSEKWVDFAVGDIDGKLQTEVYENFLSEWERLKGITESDKITPNFELMVANSANTPADGLR